VPEALGKSPYTHGKVFAVCDQRQTPHGKCGDGIKPLYRPPVTLDKKLLKDFGGPGGIPYGRAGRACVWSYTK